MFRKILLLLPLVTFVACGLAEDQRDDDDKYIYIEDKITDPVFRKFCLESYDLNGDGRLSRYEARRILDMECSGRGIASLQGIAEFGRLQTLDCSDNLLTSLDLNANALLEQVDCRGNKLGILYIDRIRMLQQLDCSNNRLMQLSLPGSYTLSYLVAGQNDLQILDISHCSSTISRLDTLGNPQLAVIYKSASQRITSLSIDGHTSLETR